MQNATVTVLGNTGTLARTGYTFNGWNTLAGGGGTGYSQGSTFPMGTGDVTLYAKWTTLPTYTVTYNGNGSTGGSVPTDSTNYLPGQMATVQSNTGALSRIGYVLVGWNTQAGGGGTEYVASDTFTMGSSNVTLYAQWTPTYTVTYNANGATSGFPPVDGATYWNGVVVTVLGNTGFLARTGYIFSGWNTQAGAAGPRTPAARRSPWGAPTSRSTLSGPRCTRVTYNANGATSGSPPVDGASYLGGAVVTVLANTGPLARAGYTFIGWNTQAGGGGTSYVGGGTFVMGAADVTLYAQWSLVPTYLVVYNGNGATTGGLPIDGNNYTTGALVTVQGPVPMARAGDLFYNWNTQPDGSGISYLPLAGFPIGSANVTLYAMWQVSTPALNPAGGHLGRTGTVTLTCAMLALYCSLYAGRLATDRGVRFPTHGTVYSGPFMLPYGVTTVNVLAYKSGAVDSAIASGTFTVPIYLYAAGRFDYKLLENIKTARELLINQHNLERHTKTINALIGKAIFSTIFD